MKKIKTLKLNYEFKNVFDQGHYIVGKQVITYYLNNNFEFNRLGIAISSKLGKAYRRNRLKRVIRSAYQIINKNNNFKINNNSYDIVFIWNKNCSFEDLNFHIILEDVENAFNKIKNRE
jgi:ribonuclease P protein component